MFPWLWSPQFYFPWSGSVLQRIEPTTNWFNDTILPTAGVADIERRVVEVASYGRQLGLIIEVLLSMAESQGSLSPSVEESVKRLTEIQEKIEAIKTEHAYLTARQIEEQLNQLKERNPAEFESLVERLRPILERKR